MWAQLKTDYPSHIRLHQLYTLYYNVTIRGKLDDIKGGKEHLSFDFAAFAVAVTSKVYKET